MTATATRKPRTKKPAAQTPAPVARQRDRKVGWAARTAHATGLLRITQDGKTYLYFVRPLREGAVEMEKLDTQAALICERYEVVAQGEEKRCTCKGFKGHGHCKHADGLAALQASGRL